VLAAAAGAGARTEGVLVSPMRPEGVDLLVGVVRDPGWGPVMAIALGGIWAEILNDVSRVALPASRAAIEAAIRSLRGAPVLLGGRGQTPIDLASLIDVVAAIASLAMSLGDDLKTIEVNPLRVSGDRIEALDATVQWR